MGFLEAKEWFLNVVLALVDRWRHGHLLKLILGVCTKCNLNEFRQSQDQRICCSGYSRQLSPLLNGDAESFVMASNIMDKALSMEAFVTKTLELVEKERQTEIDETRYFILTLAMLWLHIFFDF